MKLKYCAREDRVPHNIFFGVLGTSYFVQFLSTGTHRLSIPDMLTILTILFSQVLCAYDGGWDNLLHGSLHSRV